MKMQTQKLRFFEVRGATFPLIDPEDAVAAETISGNIYEPSLVDILVKELSQERPLFLDIGALFGYYAALVNSLVPGSTILSFEPNPEFAATLKANYELNKIRGEVFEIALVDRDSTLHFRGRTIVTDTADASIVIQGLPLDTLFTIDKMPPAMAKIDVHGSEGKVLAGMQKSLVSFIDRVVVEVHAKHLLVGGFSYEDILQLLESAGFIVFELADFRRRKKPHLIPLFGNRGTRSDFVDYSKWTDEQIKTERMIYAMRP